MRVSPPRDAPPAPALFSIVVVCTGNQIRSPVAEGVLREHTAGLPVTVTSAGTAGRGGIRAYEAALEAAAGWGVDLSRHRSRSLADVPLAEADLVLGFERQHVARAVVDGGAAPERTFTLPELVDLLELVAAPEHERTEERAREAVARAEALRASGFGVPPLREIRDPMGRRSRELRRTLEDVRELSGRLVERLFDDRPLCGR